MYMQRDLWKVELSIDPEVDAGYFSFSIQQEHSEGFDELGSYPTMLPADAEENVQERAVAHILVAIHSPLKRGEDISTICEQLTWLAPDWFEDEDVLSIS